MKLDDCLTKIGADAALEREIRQRTGDLIAQGVKPDDAAMQAVQSLLGATKAEVETVRADLAAQGLDVSIKPLPDPVVVAGERMAQEGRADIEFDAELRRVIIELRKGADLTSLAHEMGHYGALLLRKAAGIAQKTLDSGSLPEGVTEAQLRQTVADWETLRAWASDGRAGETLSEAAEENIADGYLKYLRDGRAPSLELADIFAQFRRLLAYFFRTNQVPGKPINAEVKAVFDRWLAVDAEIEQAASADSLLEKIAYFFPDKEIAAKVGQLLTRSGNRAADTLYRDFLQAERARQKAEYLEQYESVLSQLREEAAQRPEYDMQAFVRQEGGFLDEDLRRFMTPGEFKKFPADLRGGKLPIEAVAVGPWGYDSEIDVIRAVTQNPTAENWAKAEAKKIMDAQYSDIRDDGRAQEFARAYANGTDVGRAIDMLVEAAGSKKTTRRALRRLAEDRIADTAIRDLRPDKYIAARDKALREAFRKGTIAKGGDAAVLLWKALVNNEMQQVASEARVSQIKSVSKWREFILRDAARQARVNKRLSARYDVAVLDVARNLLARHGIGQSPEGPDLAEGLKALGEQEGSVLAAAQAAFNLQPKPHKDLTVADFDTLSRGVENLLAVARDRKATKIGETRIEVAAGQAAIIAAVNKLRGGKLALNSSEVVGDRAWSRAKAVINMRGFMGLLTRIEHFADYADGGDVNGAFTTLVRLVKSGANQYHDAQMQLNQRFMEIIKPLEKTLDSVRIDAPELAGGSLVVYGRRNLLAIMLNWGNKGNRQRLADGYGLTVVQLDSFLKRMAAEGRLTKADWDAVQGIWGLFESIKGPAWEVHRTAYGYRPDDVTAEKVETPFGDYAGGYYPVMYDPRQSSAAKVRSLEQLAKEQQFDSIFPTPQPGWAKDRAKQYVDKILLDPTRSAVGMAEVLKFTYLHQPVSYAIRVFGDPQVQNAIAAFDPGLMQNVVLPWLTAARRQGAAGAILKGGKFADALNTIRNRTAAGTMFLNMVNTAQQLTDIPSAVPYVGAKNLIAASAELVENHQEISEFVLNASGEMRNRVNLWNEDLPSEVAAILDNYGRMQRAEAWAMKHAYVTQRFVQYQVDLVVWMAGYKRATQELFLVGDDAVFFADRAVRLSQGSSRMEDKAAITTMLPKEARSMLMFYDWFNNKTNQLVYGSRRGVAQSPFARRAAAVGAFVALTQIIPAVAGQLVYDFLRNNMPDDEDRDGGSMDDWAYWAFRANASTLTAQLPFVGGIAQQALDKATGHQSFGIAGPVSRTLQSAAQAPVSLYNAFEGEGTNSRAFKDAMAALTLLGVPAGQLGRTGGYLLDVQQGEVQPESVGDVARGLVAGSPPSR